MKRRKISSRQKKAVRRKFLYLKHNVFFLVLLLFALIGILIPLRPTVSALENRTLSAFPSFTLSSFLNGDFTSDISTWYADTFPFREKLLSLNSAFESLYGLQSETIVQNTAATADEIPEDGVMVTTDDEETEEVIEEEETVYVDGAIQVVPEQAGTVYVTGDTAFSIYYFSLSGANAYINMIDQAQQCLDGIAEVYDILVPTSIGICLSEEAQDELGSSSQSDAIDYIYSNIESLNSSVHTVDIYQTLINHNSEYIYFRTDHHWTALGAYYAYLEFCDAKGIEGHTLTEYSLVQYEGFLGSFYSSSNQAQSLKENPDTVIGYIPLSTNEMFYIDSSGNRIDWKIVNDVSNYSQGSKYSAFAAGDEIYAQIDNPELDDGSACVVIKESYGNAFIPFLTDHYQTIYIVDYRYFDQYSEYDNSVYELVTQNNVTDVIIINNMEAATSTNKVSMMSALFE